MSCKVDRNEVRPAGAGVVFAVAPGTLHGRRDRRPFQMLRDVPTVSFPRGASMWWNRERARRALERWLAADGAVSRVTADMMPDLAQLLHELHARQGETVLDVSWDWLTAADAGVTKLWTPRAGVAVAA